MNKNQVKDAIFAAMNDPQKRGCGRCGKKDDATEEKHSCPYAEEIKHDFSENCNCCHECIRECLMDI